jgi:hypothetical protein
LVVIMLWGSLAGWDNALQIIHTSISNSLHCIKQHRSSVLRHQAWTCSHHCPFFLFFIWWVEFNRPKSKFIRGTWWSIVYHNTLLGSAVKIINTNILETLERSHTYFQVVNNVIINKAVVVTCGWWFFVMCNNREVWPTTSVPAKWVGLSESNPHTMAHCATSLTMVQLQYISLHGGWNHACWVWEIP